MTNSPKVQEILEFSAEEITEGLLNEMDCLAEYHCRLDDHMGELLSQVSEHFIAGSLSTEVQTGLKAEYDLASEEQTEAGKKLKLLYGHFGVENGLRVC